MTLASGPPQLCLVVETAPAARDRCAAALSTVRIATLIVSPLRGGALDREEANKIVDLGHAKDVAVLIEDDVGLASSLGADGVHLRWREDAEASYAAARTALGPNAIVGVDAGHSRHDAMSLGESGADYIAFGLARETPDRITAETQRFDLVEWWAEIFEIPVVALDVETTEEAAPLIAAGADFIAVRLPADKTPDQVAAWARDIAQGLEVQLLAS